MRRRDFVKHGSLGAVALGIGAEARGKLKAAPDYLPIVKDKIAGGSYLPYYEEREITQRVPLCDDAGNLNPDAKGWSRAPLHRCNISGHWPHKKKWNYWCVIGPEFAFSFNPINLDYAGRVASAFFLDFKEKKYIEATALGSSKNTGLLPDEVEKSVTFDGKKLKLSLIHEPGGIKGNLFCPSMKGVAVTADFKIHKPEGHETLNVVIPWTADRFQFTSKQNTLPTEGTVTVGDKRYIIDPEKYHAVMDFGRGMWPYRTYWNWGVVTGVMGKDVIGLNLGAKWTTGTGANENGICFNGKLTKIMEDLVWEYDCNNWMKPWRVRSGHTDMVDLTLTPSYLSFKNANLGLMGAFAGVCFGTWSGTLKFDGKTVEIDKLMGWGEEIRMKW